MANQCRGKMADEAQGIKQKSRPKPNMANGNGQVSEVTEDSLKAITWESTNEKGNLNY
jgi:hypothetical protein